MPNPPTLLTLPAEIRQKILYHALCHQRSFESFISNTIVVTKLLDFESRNGRIVSPDKREYFYGTEIMSSMFLVCRLIHAELEEILFTRFVFHVDPTSAQQFTTTIGPRACKLIREIVVEITYVLTVDATPTEDYQNFMVDLKEKLPFLKKVDVAVVFLEARSSGKMTKCRIDGFIDRIMEFVMGFASGLEVVVAGKEYGVCEKAIMNACSDKIEELMASWKREGLVYDIKGLKFHSTWYANTSAPEYPRYL